MQRLPIATGTSVGQGEMSFAMRLERLNAWYEKIPEDWRFQTVVWLLVAVGAINMALTIAIKFPFGLLVLLAILAVACVRVPFVMGWLKPEAAQPAGSGPGARLEIEPYQWVHGVNRWYDALPETSRPWVLVAILVIAGAINMMLTIAYGFSFGILFLLALLAVIAVRGPYVAGWLTPAPVRNDSVVVAPHTQQIAQETAQVGPAVDDDIKEKPPIALDPDATRDRPA